MFKTYLRKREKETSTLNTDSFDRRRFNQIYEMSKGLQKIEMNEEIPLFKELLSDMWASLYKTNPELKENDKLHEQLLPNKQLIQRMMAEESYQRYRKSTQLDDLLSAVGTINFGKETNKWLEEQKQENEKIKELVDQIQQFIEQLNKGKQQKNSMEKEDGEGQEENDGAEQGLNQAMSDLAKELGKSLDENGQSFSLAMNNAVEETENAKKGLESLFGGTHAGNQKGEFQRMPLRHKIALAERISYDPKFKKIADWAGKYTKIAQTKQKMKYKNVTEQSGVETGDNLERILPSELALYKNPSTKKEFLRKYAEKETLQYEQKGKESLGRGSIILCLDQSGSMINMEEESKGFALALLSIAKKQKRNFAYIPFSGYVGKVDEFPKGKIKPDEMVRLAVEFRGGGTSFQPPLHSALEIIKKDRFKDADIVFITDGNSSVSDEFISSFNEKKEKNKFQVLSLLIGNGTRGQTVRLFSDQVIRVNNLNEEGSFDVFEI